MATKKLIFGFICLIIIAILILVSVIRANAADYYFDATLGNDGNSGSQASPKRTITGTGGFNSIFSGLNDGDRVFFKRGEIFYGSLNVNNSGSSGSPITISNYGNSALPLPIISGLITIDDGTPSKGWTSSTPSGVYESSEFLALPSKLKVVLIDDVLYSIGRWPDQTNWKQGVYRTINSESYFTGGGRSHQWVIDNSLSATPDWDGATFVMHSARWTIHSGRITSHDGTKINYTFDFPITNHNGYPFCNNDGCNGYFIQNHQATLTKYGEWYHNPTTDKIKIYFGGVNPASVTVKTSSFENLLTATSKSYITVDGLKFIGANGNAINISGGSNFIVKNCEIIYSGRDGINSSGSSTTIDNNTISYSYNDGVRLGGSNNTTTNNLINYTYFAAGMGVGGTGVGNGISNSDNSLVQYNRILNSGYVGIHVGSSKVAGQSSRIINNFIDTILFVLDDGGGIYDYVGHGDPGSDDYYVNQSQKIIGNIILNQLTGGRAGAKGGVTYSSGAGLYPDDGTNHMEITGNVIGSMPSVGLYLHNTTGSTVTNNISYGATRGAVKYLHDGNGWAVRDVVTTGNVFFARTTSQQYTAHYEGISIGTMTFNNNYYAKPIGETSSESTTEKHIKYASANYSLQGWKNASGKDANSTKTWPSPITSQTEVRFEYNELKVAKVIQLNGTFKDIQGNTYVCSATLQPFTGKIFIKTSPTTCSGNICPTVSLTSPANNATFVAPASIPLVADAADADGTITKVEFYNGGTLLATDNTSPYSFTWTSVPIGNYSITAKATDNSGCVTTSSPISVTVTNPPPVVSITLPANGASFVAPATVQINADASDANGISSVVFYKGSTVLSTDNSSPYSYTWNSVPAGNYSLTARATDNLGAVAVSSAIGITVTGAGNICPTVSLTLPANNATFTAPATVTINADADDADGTVANVRFKNGATVLSTDNSSPYFYVWNSVAAGTYFITAEATDNSGCVTTSSSISITVSNPPPIVSITLPANNADFTSPGSVTINATASDANGISLVEFYNSETLLGTDNTSPYSFAWTSVPAGTYFLTAKATDALGAFTTSTAVRITVTDPTNLPPVVNVTAPANNATYIAPATVNMTATASDPDGFVTVVGFYLGGVSVGSDNTSPYSFSFSIPAAGTYKLTARATDNGGLTSTSSEITIVVNDPDDIYPSVSITSPIYNASYTAPANIYLFAEASDVDGTISKVEFYNGATLLKIENGSPYEFNWNNVAVGNYTITARAYDNDGNITISTAIPITVTNPPPVVNITSPQNNSSFLPSATIQFRATATDANGTITNVKFYDGSTLLQTEVSAPYEFTRGGFAAGNHTLTAVATDNNGAVTTSSPFTFTISGDNPTPIVTPTAPTEGQVFTSHTNVVLTATATDDGSIANVKFYNGATLLNTDNTAPYTFTWNDVSVGSKTITYTATDNLGATGSAVVNFTVVNINPTVSISSPANNATYVAPGSINIAATANDANGSVTQVAFYNGGVLIGTDNSSPYTFSWTGVPTGTYALTARVTDNDGGMDTSDVVTVTSTNTAPTVSLTGTIISANPWLIDLAATAADVNGSIVKVDFYDGSTLLAEEAIAPFEYTVTPAGSGTFSFSAIAMDNDSATTTSNTVVITLAAPVVSITSVTVTDNIVPGIVDIAATATDNVSVAKVEFYANDILIGTDLTSPYTFSWTNVADGIYVIHAVATDNDGATTTTPDEAPIEILGGVVSITNLLQTYDGTPKPVNVTVSPPAAYTVTYSDDPNPPTNAGTYTVVATSGASSATETLVIAKADPGLAWEIPEPITYLEQLTSTELDATANVAGTFTYTPAAGTVLGAGVNTLSVIFTPTDLTNYNRDTALVNLIVDKALAVLTITSASEFVYDGTPKVATATVSPSVGVITITYNGSLIPPTEAGVYTIVVTLEADNYAADLVSGTMEILPVSQGEIRNFLLLNRSKIVNLPQ